MIGERLYDLRKDKGLSQDELGELLNINKHSISSYERGRSEPPDEIKIIIAKFFDVSIDYLLVLTDVPNAYSNEFHLIKLPKSFPMCEEDELKRFISYLMFKHKRELKRNREQREQELAKEQELEPAKKQEQKQEHTKKPQQEQKQAKKQSQKQKLEQKPERK